MLQNDVQLFKVMKYKKGYHDGGQGKLLRYHLGNEDEILVQKTSEMPVEVFAVPADAPSVVAGAKIGGGIEPDPQAGTSQNTL